MKQWKEVLSWWLLCPLTSLTGFWILLQFLTWKKWQFFFKWHTFEFLTEGGEGGGGVKEEVEGEEQSWKKHYWKLGNF